MVSRNDDHNRFLLGRRRAEVCFITCALDSFSRGERDAVFLLRTFFRLDRAALIFCEPRQILHGNLVIDQNLDRSCTAKFFQRIHRLNHGQRASVAQSIDLNHDKTSYKLFRSLHTKLWYIVV